ncbi:MAG: flagellar motor switch protein FliG [Pirellulaceae bacterium]|nr:flagellar motor switch protein FliG [Pirellulaceae bacterium]
MEIDMSAIQQSEGVRKAAILLMSLEEDSAAQILAMLPRRFAEKVSIAIAQLDLVSTAEQENVINEFLNTRPSALNPSSGGINKAKTLVKKALGKDAGDMLNLLQQTLESMPFGFLHKADAQNILTFLIDEHPQTIALVLSHLPPPLAATVLCGFPTQRQLAIVERVAEMGQTSPEAIEEVEKGLSARMALFMTQAYQKAGGIPAVAEILNVSDRATERNIFDGLAKNKSELVEEIRRLMFVFEDLIKISDKDIQTVLKSIDSSQWALALKGASQPLQDKILGNMSQRAAEMLREEMSFVGKVRLAEVESMQQKIVDVVRSLEDSGQLQRPSGDGEEEFVT